MQVHLFDIDIPGKQTFKESDTLTAGDSLTVVDTDCGKLGIGICYDIRFPEMAALYARKGVQLLVYPGVDEYLIKKHRHEAHEGLPANITYAEVMLLPSSQNCLKGT